MTSRNWQLFEKSQQLIPGGVNSPVRAFRSVGGTPLFFERGGGHLGCRRHPLRGLGPGAHDLGHAYPQW